MTIKQEKFTLKYFECGNASEAYKHAYDAEKMKDEVIAIKAHELLKNGKIRVMLDELRAKAKEATEWNVQKLISSHAEIFEIAMGRVASPHIVTEGAGLGISETLEVEMRDTSLMGATKALVEIGKLIGAYEKDNKQKAGELSLKDFAKEFYFKIQGDKK